MRAGVIWGWFGVRWGGVCGVESTRTDGGRAGGARDWGGGKGPVGYTAPEPQKERNERTDGRTDDDDDNYRMYKRAAFSPHSLQTHVFVLLFWPPKVLSVDFLRAGRRGGFSISSLDPQQAGKARLILYPHPRCRPCYRPHTPPPPPPPPPRHHPPINLHPPAQQTRPRPHAASQHRRRERPHAVLVHDLEDPVGLRDEEADLELLDGVRHHRRGLRQAQALLPLAVEDGEGEVGAVPVRAEVELLWWWLRGVGGVRGWVSEGKCVA